MIISAEYHQIGKTFPQAYFHQRETVRAEPVPAGPAAPNRGASRSMRRLAHRRVCPCGRLHSSGCQGNIHASPRRALMFKAFCLQGAKKRIRGDVVTSRQYVPLSRTTGESSIAVMNYIHVPEKQRASRLTVMLVHAFVPAWGSPVGARS